MGKLWIGYSYWYLKWNHYSLHDMLPVALSPRPEYRASLVNVCVKGQRGDSPIKSRICVIGNRSRPTWLTVSAGSDLHEHDKEVTYVT